MGNRVGNLRQAFPHRDAPPTLDRAGWPLVKCPFLIDRKEETHGRQDVALQAPPADAEAATQAQAEKADGEKTDLIISVLIPLGACPNSDST